MCRVQIGLEMLTLTLTLAHPPSVTSMLMCCVQIGLDMLMFLEPFGLLPVVPISESMRYFIPAYANPNPNPNPNFIPAYARIRTCIRSYLGDRACVTQSPRIL